MIRNALRRELTELLSAFPGCRQPVLRRSMQDEWLYATDIPILFNGIVPDALQKSLADAGWEYIQEGNWLHLRKTIQQPPGDWYAGPFGPEAFCCLSLILRHPANSDKSVDSVQRMLVKAGEQGEKAYEDVCAALHREWAVRLRQKIPLPAVSRHYFGE